MSDWQIRGSLGDSEDRTEQWIWITSSSPFNIYQLDLEFVYIYHAFLSQANNPFPYLKIFNAIRIIRIWFGDVTVVSAVVGRDDVGVVLDGLGARDERELVLDADGLDHAGEGVHNMNRF